MLTIGRHIERTVREPAYQLGGGVRAGWKVVRESPAFEQTSLLTFPLTAAAQVADALAALAQGESRN